MSDSERRHFSRVTFDAETSIQQNTNLWMVTLIDLSLKGLLIDKPEDWDGDAQKNFHISIHLDDSTNITMEVVERHQTDQHIGFECHHIDIDSIAHLRRLVELNLGNQVLLERELSALGG